MNPKKLLKLSFLAIAITLACALFIPRNYNVSAFKKRTGTQYWQLSTGSTIGYLKIEHSSAKHNYPIVFLHGGPGGMITDATIEALLPLSKQGHDLYFYDQIGSGHSARLNNISEYTVQRHLADLIAIIEKINAPKVILIGHSWGCLLATAYIQDHQQNVACLILDGPGPILPINTALTSAVAPDSLNLKKPASTNKEGNKKAYNLRAQLVLKWAYAFSSKLATDDEADNFFTFLNQELSKSTYCNGSQSIKIQGGGGYYAHLMTVKSFSTVKNERDKLQKAQIPILILRGQCDNQNWGFAKEYIDLFKHSQIFIVNNSGHDIINGNKEAYVQHITKFLQKVTSYTSP